MALCPSHPDRKASLAIAEGKKGVVIKCMSAGCETRDILAALGLGWGDLFEGKPTPQVRARTSLYDQRENLERQLGLVLWLKALENGPRLNRRSDESSKQFDAVLRQWRPIGNGEPNDGR